MKKIISVLCLLMALVAPVAVSAQQCDTIQVPWYEDFETTPQDSLADCWVLYRQGTGQASITANELRFVINNGDNFIVALPPVELPPDSIYFRFHAHYWGTVDFVYGVMSNPADTNTFFLIDTLPFEANSDWAEISFSTLGLALTDTLRLAFKFRTPTYATIYLDNFYIDRAAGCSIPEAAWTYYVDTTSATLKWHCDPPYSGFVVTLNDTLQFSTPDTLIDLVNLTPNTLYEYSLRTVCPGGELSPELLGSFRTSCDAVQLPYYENFGSYNNNAIPACWRILRGLHYYAGSLTYTPSVYTGELIFRNIDDSVTIVATPMIAHPCNALHIGFDMARSSYTELTVGLLHNPYDLDGFIPVATFEAFEENNTGREHCEVYTEMVSDTSFAYVVFYFKSHYMGNYLYLDNVSVEVADSCHDLSEAHYLDIGENSITVAWTDYSISPQGYEVRYSRENNVDSAEFSFFTVSTIFTADNLELNMSYYFWVRSLCDGDSERWFPVGYVRTECGQPLLPYMEYFESYQEQEIIPCWEYYHVDSTTSDPFVRSYSVAHSEPRVWAFNMPYTDTVLAVLPSFGINARNLEVSFWLSQYNGCFEAGLYNTFSGEFTPVIRQLGNINSTYVTQQYMFQCDTVNAATNNSRIAFRWSSHPDITSMFTSQAAYLDDLRIRHIPYCHAADSVEVNNITYNSAMVQVYDSWNTGLYRVLYTDGHTVDTAVGYGDNIQLSGLQHSTYYNIEVSGYCVDGTMTDPVFGLFHTGCMALSHNDMPYVETFDDYTDGVHINPCWSRHSYNTSYPNYPIPYQGIFYPQDTMVGVSMQFPVNSNYSAAYSEIMVLPSVDYTTDLYVDFMAKAGNAYTHVDVGIMEDPADLSTFYRISTCDFQNVNTWTHFSVPLNEYNGYGSYIAFGAYSGATYSDQLYIDNVKVDIIPQCSDSLTWLYASDVGSTCATVSWNAGVGLNENAQYLVHVLDSAGNELFVDTATTHTHTMCSLDEQTTYRVYVDLYCDSSVVATTTHQVGFTTQCGLINTIGIGSSNNGATISAYLPIVLQNNTSHSATEQLFLASEMQNTAGMITDMQMYLASSNVLQDIVECTIRLGHTSDNVMSQWVEFDSLELVYEGPMNFRHGWNTISFARPFHYNGIDNLVVAIDAVKYGLTNNGQFQFGTRPAFNSSALIIYDVSGQSLYSVYYRNRVRFGMCIDQSEICQPPSVTSYSTTDMSITIDFTPTPCEVHITQGWWSRSFTGVMDSTGSHTFEGLAPATEYTIGLRHHCSNGDRSMWTIRRITTDPVEALPPLVMTLDSVTYNSVTVNWQPRATETRWEVRLFNPMTDVRAVLTDTAYFFNGLTSMTTYHVSVRSLCGSDYSIISPWSDTLTFTTDYCHPVTDILVTDVTETTAHVSWTPSRNSVSWKVEYGYEGFLRGEAIGSYNASTPALDLDSLEPGTSYDLYVASVCGPGMSSSWVGTDPFRTVGNNDITTTPDGTGFVVYPNPASSFVTVKLDNGGPEARIDIIDQQGRTVATSTGSATVIDVSRLSTGVYFVRISGPSYSAAKKLIVK